MEEKQRLRSPRYPSVSLVEAVEMARKIFAKDGMNSVDRESAVQHLGYSSLNGASATALAALKQYGLVNDSGKGTLRLSDLALDLLEPETEAGRAAAIRTAAFNPDLFASLFERFPGSIPSESNLRAHLLRQQFSNSAVKAVVPAYLATCEYLETAKTFEQNNSLRKTVSEKPEMEGLESQGGSQEPLNASPSPTYGDTSRSNRRMIFDTEEGEVVFTYPDNLSEESVEDIEEWFALVTKRLRRATKQ